ncbi:ABC transporter ATP-binding protein [Deltaproteobacteria bacterium]|nr:ABC transporter ATP-binding protein [Deltaproteobacteria bacterium]
MGSKQRPVLDPLTPPAPVLRVSGLGKRFDIYPNDRSRFFEFLGSRSHHREHWAVRGLDLELRPGEAIGIIGNNGAGKSTILRLLASITEPTEGSIELQGRLSALLDLGVGFQEGFTGRENIELGCQLLGLDVAQIEERMPEMIRFAELGQFIDDPVRTYSTGMALRLGFAVAVHVDADVLLIDEVLAVGDQYFQRKCIRRIQSLFERGTSLVLVSHDLHAVRALCTEVVWMEGGRARVRGPAREVVEAYLDQSRVLTARSRGDAIEPAPPSRPRQGSRPVAQSPEEHIESRSAICDAVQRATAPGDAAEVFSEAAGEAPRVEDGENLVVSGTGEARILKVQLLDGNGVEHEQFHAGDSLVVAVTFRTVEPIEDPIFGVALFRNDGTYVYGPNTGFDGVLKGTWSGVYTFFVHYPALPLLAGTYRVSVAIYDKGHVSPMAWHNQLYEFQIVQDVDDHGLVRLPHRWGMIVHHDETGGR